MCGLSVQQAAQLFRLLGNERRLAIVMALVRHGEADATALGQAIGLSPEDVRGPLGFLLLGHLVEARRDGHHIFYRVRAPLVMHLLEAFYRAGSGARSPSP